MKTLISILTLAAFVIISAAGAGAELVTDIQMNSGYQANLFNDSTTTGDTYAGAGLSLKYYPTGSAQVSGGVSYNAFATYRDLSSLSSELSATIIPTSTDSRITIALSGDLASRSFGTIYQAYDRTSAGGGVSVGLRAANWMHFHASVYARNETYSNSDYGSNQGFDLATGINVSIPGSNSLALRFDFSRRDYDQPEFEPQGTGNARFGDGTTTQNFDVSGVTVRFSRPLGIRTGMNLSAGYRQLSLDHEYSVLGYTIDYLSPWSDLWEGASFSTGLKHFLPRQFIAELSYAYFDKKFVDVVEYAESNDELYVRDSRDDRLNLISLSISRPLSVGDGDSIVPSVFVGYRRNVSTLDYYDYDDIVASISIKASL